MKRIGLALAGPFLPLVAAVVNVEAKPFDRHPDGRVVIEIFGQKVGLPAEEPDLDRITFYPSPGSRNTYGKTLIPLRDVLTDPDKARAAFEENTDWVSIHITAGGPNETRPLLERFARELVPSSSPANPLSITIYRNCPRNALARGRLPDWLPPESASPDEDGYFMRPGITGPRQSAPDEAWYRLPAAQRLWPTNTDLVVVCRRTGGPVRECRQTQQTEDRCISVGWGWDEASYQTVRGWSSPYFPKQQWRELDLRLHEIAESVLLNKPSGDLQ